jgi:hypothetical protein
MPYHSFTNNDVNKREQGDLPQNVQNERKISNHLALNHPNYHSADNKLLQNQRLKRDTNSLIDEYDEYNDQNDGMLLWLYLCVLLKLGKYFNADPRVDVEFFEPKFRSELEQRDAEIVKKTGKSAANGDEWTWLTQYCRIPVSITFGWRLKFK